MRFLRVLLCAAVASGSLPAASEPAAGPAVEQLGSIHNTRSAREAYDGGKVDPAGAVKLGSKTPGTKARPAVTAARVESGERRAVIEPVPEVAAAKSKLPPGTYGAEAPEMGWDWDRTVFSAGTALAGAAIGFMVGGPIGAAMGFVAGFFLGALASKAMGIGT
ncbi:MAG: hypothetical protein AUJ52_14975 [Elusimicrobia bacterium CG1_02_63_36]|nr:MAG: hypothetical protein AUJ52_14975 [Elusimicrobia bacterium CG1_02_63_36]PJA14608.1 MAG: hypothetical protein COX66_12270 [Elusimicrobia bacterium CG_4_10_14_0_2_um_filter_63_34]PJB26809.1 MAG: hypothetical protein CO113_01345 [Elusimicrobia bacterium CG_4_9_14_3_um_filter_62_55]